MGVITRRITMAQIMVTGYMTGAFDRMRRDDRGQGSVEYVGIILVVAAILIAVLAFVRNGNGDAIGTVILQKVQDAINSIS